MRLKKRGVIWYAWVPQREGGTKLVSTRCTDKEAARRQSAELERRAVDPGYAAAQGVTTRAVLTDYTTSRTTQGRSSATIRYVRQKAGHLARLLPMRAAHVTHLELQGYIEARLEEGVARATIKKELGVFSAAWKLARRNGSVTQDPKVLVPDLDSDSKTKTRALSPLEVMAIVASLPPDRGARVAWIVATGARWGESCRAQREDHDFPARLVHLRGTKTKASVRRVPILGVADSMLRWALEHARGGIALFAPWPNVRRDLHASCKRLGIAPVSPNDLRRTFATWLREAGLEPGLIATALGHTTSRMVELHYGRLSAEGLRDLLATRSIGALAVRNMSSDAGERDNAGQSLTIDPLGKKPETLWPEWESDPRHADFQAAEFPRDNAVNVGDSPIDWSECVGQVPARTVLKAIARARAAARVA